MTMLADLQEVPMRVNAVMFRRGVVGGLLLSMTIEGKPEDISFQELAEWFDQHVQESLNTAEEALPEHGPFRNLNNGRTLAS